MTNAEFLIEHHYPFKEVILGPASNNLYREVFISDDRHPIGKVCPDYPGEEWGLVLVKWLDEQHVEEVGIKKLTAIDKFSKDSYFYKIGSKVNELVDAVNELKENQND